LEKKRGVKSTDTGKKLNCSFTKKKDCSRQQKEHSKREFFPVEKVGPPTPW
jgi:hypothetical protein